MARRTTWLVWAIVALSVGLFAAGAVYLGLTPPQAWSRRSFLWPVDPNNLSLLAYLAVGAIIALRRPHNPIGWIFCAAGLSWQLFGFAQAYASYLALVVPAALNVRAPLLVLAENLWVISFGLMPFLLFVFPDGRLPSRRWRPVVWFLGLLVAADYGVVASDFRAGHVLVSYPSPLSLLLPHLDTALLSSLADSANSALLLGFLASGAALVWRWRRAPWEERQQMKWFVSAGVLVLLVVVVTSAFMDVLRPLDPEALYAADFLYGIPYALAVALVPVAAGIAILKYRLFDIDLIIRRTLIYGVLTVALALTYFGSVLLLQSVFIRLTGQSRSQLVAVVSTLAIAALFAPLRRWIQRQIDRRFYRPKYDTAMTLAAFGSAMRDQVDLNTLTDELLAVVATTMQPAHLSLWLRPSERAPRR